jgi:hypothetical protein
MLVEDGVDESLSTTISHANLVSPQRRIRPYLRIPISNVPRLNSNFTRFARKTTDSIEIHIDKFSALQQEVDYHRPASIPPMTPAQINLAFIRTLREAWFTFQKAISTRIHTMKTAQLYAEVKVADESEHLDNKTPVYRANVTTRGGKGGRGGFRGSYHKGSGNRGGPGYQEQFQGFESTNGMLLLSQTWPLDQRMSQEDLQR